MDFHTLEQNYHNFLSTLPKTNPYGEKITVVGACKTQPTTVINHVIGLGLKDVGENRAQEFRDKLDHLSPCNYHFIGRLQSNKIKYLIGKVHLIHSVDSLDLAKEISRQSKNANVTTNILLEVNFGEAQKGGFPLDGLQKAYNDIASLDNICVKGLMAVMPNVDNINLMRENCLQLRRIYDIMRKTNENITVLSMGMSNDYQLAIECGSNMIRIGTKIFGQRNYNGV